MITPELAKRLFGLDNPVGRDLHVGELIFTIIGVFKERVETFGLSDIQTETVLIPFGLIKYYAGREYIEGAGRAGRDAGGRAESTAGIDGIAEKPASEHRGVQRAGH